MCLKAQVLHATLSRSTGTHCWHRHWPVSHLTSSPKLLERLQGQLLKQLQTFVSTASAPGFVAFAQATRAGEALRSVCDSLVYEALMLKVQTPPLKLWKLFAAVADQMGGDTTVPHCMGSLCCALGPRRRTGPLRGAVLGMGDSSQTPNPG